MKIVKWDEWNTNKYEDFKKIKERECAIKILINNIRENQYHFDGYYHQNGEHGAPVFNNGKQLRFTFRGWGKIMAESYPDEIDNTDGFGYCDWAWVSADEKLLKYPR